MAEIQKLTLNFVIQREIQRRLEIQPEMQRRLIECNILRIYLYSCMEFNYFR